MPIHPHIHCFLPSSSPHINLEARLYLPLTDNHAIPLTTQLATYTSPPVYYDKLDVETVGAIREMGIERLITAAHPWGRMGGNMLDPVLCHLVSATFTPAETTDRALISPLLPPPKTAILTYNVRGVGCSQGSQPWLGIGSDPADLSKVETVVSDLLGNLKQVMRFAALGIENTGSSALLPKASPIQVPPRATPDDSAIKAHFDLPHSIFGDMVDVRSGHVKGLFLYDPLTEADSLRRLTDRTLIQASAIVQRIVVAPQDPTGRELRLVVKNLDRLSDILCGVIDMCELVRNVHPHQDWGLYESLAKAIAHPFNNPLTTSELRVAHTFLADFERSGIHLPPSVRERFVKHSDALLSLGRSFLSSASSGPSTVPHIEIPDPHRLLMGLGRQFVDSLPRKGRSGQAVIEPGSWEAQMILRYAREGRARELVYIGGMSADKTRINVLEAMLKERAELASVLGKNNWAEVALADKMTKTPENVMGFLTSLAQHHQPVARAEVDMLRRIKATVLTGNYYDLRSPRTRHLPPFYAWDKDYYSDKYLASLIPTGSPPSISPYFSTGTMMSGLSRIFSKLYGISFKPAVVSSGEVWHPSVRRLDVVHEEEGLVGVIYCDFFSRIGKASGAAHYTVRCSRRVDDDDIDGDGLPEDWDKPYGPGLETDGESLRGKPGKYQLPIIALSMDVGTVNEGRPALLNWHQLETLFHEMGHAIHSMIGRTEYHNVSGTRCATDFVELPSILMEHFISSPEVLSTFAFHYATGEPLPIPVIEAHLALNQSLSALETHGQIAMALLDQKYHTLRHGQDVFDSTAIWFQLQQEIGVIQPVPGTAWQTQFCHLYGYGATYYSYLFDRAIAGKMWSTLFHRPGASQAYGQKAEGILSREGGELLKEKVLKWGGGRDPWEMVGDVIGGVEGEELSKGDERALALVGSWTVV
ncbi:mitochondrial intermediate peptidase 2 [Cryptococcus neoformans]|nr:mitochondrial intermediate peptidase 2 [Cryptococcus neoformans]